MFKTIHRIPKILKSFNEIPSGFDTPKAKKFKIKNIDEAPGSQDLMGILHHQGVEVLDGNVNMIIVGSTRGHPGYGYVVKDGNGQLLDNGNHHFLIDQTYTHPGGVQAAEDILAIGNEQYNGLVTRSDRSMIRFYDISDDQNITELRHLAIRRDSTTGYHNEAIASALGITKFHDQWIVAVRSKQTLDFYTYKGDLKNPSACFTRLGSLDREKHHIYEYQSIYLYFSTADKLYMFGMPRKSENDDKCYLHLIKKTEKNGIIKKITGATTIRVRHFKRNGRGPRFKWASCIEFIPDASRVDGGKFRIYSIEANVNNHEIRGNYWSS